MIKSVVPARAITEFSNEKAIYRVIGTTDVHGKGTAHAIGDVDPFILLDEAMLNPRQGSPFDRHPHAGLVAVSYVLEGAIKTWDNLSGEGKHYNQAGGVYYINSGRGIVHGESPVPFADGDAEDKRLRWLQLWINPGVHSPLLKASTQLASRESIPIVRFGDATVRILIGDAYQKASPIKSDWPVLYLHVTVAVNKSWRFSELPPGWQGFFYVLKGHGDFGPKPHDGQVKDCLVFSVGDQEPLTAINKSSQYELEFIVAAGKPHRRNFVKLLGHGGAMVAGSLEEANRIMTIYQSDPENFGR